MYTNFRYPTFTIRSLLFHPSNASISTYRRAVCHRTQQKPSPTLKCLVVELEVCRSLKQMPAVETFYEARKFHVSRILFYKDSEEKRFEQSLQDVTGFFF